MVLRKKGPKFQHPGDGGPNFPLAKGEMGKLEEIVGGVDRRCEMGCYLDSGRPEMARESSTWGVWEYTDTLESAVVNFNRWPMLAIDSGIDQVEYVSCNSRRN